MWDFSPLRGIATLKDVGFFFFSVSCFEAGYSGEKKPNVYGREIQEKKIKEAEAVKKIKRKTNRHEEEEEEEGE